MKAPRALEIKQSPRLGKTQTFLVFKLRKLTVNLSKIVNSRATLARERSC